MISTKQSNDTKIDSKISELQDNNLEDSVYCKRSDNDIERYLRNEGVYTTTTDNDIVTCKKCGMKLNSDIAFCPKCGKKVKTPKIKIVNENKSISKIWMILAIIFAACFVGIGIAFGITLGKINEKNTEIAKLQASKDKLEDKVSDMREDASDLGTNSNAYYAELYEDIYDDWEFFDNNAACVNKNDEYYHKPWCKYFDDSYYWIYNTATAEGKGYKPCPYCY